MRSKVKCQHFRQYLLRQREDDVCPHYNWGRCDLHEKYPTIMPEECIDKEIIQKRPCDEAIAEVKEFLEDCGFQDVKYWKDTRQIDGILSREITQGEVTYHILVDFVEDKVLLEAKAETDGEYEDFQQETWQGLPDLYDTIIIMLKHYGIFQGLPPKPKWKKLKLQLTP